MVVGFGPGGGYDIFSRLIAPYLAKVLGTTVVVENQPGAGGFIALNRIFQGPPDGLTLSLSNGTGAAFGQITGPVRPHVSISPSSASSPPSAHRPDFGWSRRSLPSAK